MSASPNDVIIPNVTAAQLVGSDLHPLVTGTLTLQLAPPRDDREVAATEESRVPILLLYVEEKLFPLYKDTVMGTHEGQELWYTFNLPTSSSKSESSSSSEPTPTTSSTSSDIWVRLVLPPLTDDSLLSKRDKFEQALIQHGLLLDGLLSTGDELGKSFSQSGISTSQSLEARSKEHRSTTSATDSPWTFSRTSHKIAQGANSSTRTLSQVTSLASDLVGSLASSAGQVVGSAYQSTKDNLFTTEESRQEAMQQEEMKRQTGGEKEDDRYLPNTRDAINSAFEGASEGVSSLYTTTTNEVPKVVEHNYGSETKDLVGEAGNTVGNLGQATADVTVKQSTIFHGVSAAKGASQAE